MMKVSSDYVTEADDDDDQEFLDGNRVLDESCQGEEVES